MDDRIRMNTKFLQEKFPDVYQQFFAENDMVLSTNFSFMWSPIGLSEYEYMSFIKQKLATRAYLGIKKNQNGKINFQEVLYFDIVKNNFDTAAYDKFNKKQEEIGILIKNFLENNSISYGLDISILCENSRGHGLAFSGTIGGLLATVLFLLVGLIDSETFDDYDGFIKSDVFKHIHQLGWEIDFISRFEVSNGVNPLMSIHNSSAPIFYLAENYNDEIDFDKISKIGIKYRDLAKDFGLNIEFSDIALDYGIIFSGIPTKTQQIEHYRKFNLSKEDEIREFIETFIYEGDDLNKNYGTNELLAQNNIVNQFNKIQYIMNIQLLNYIYNYIKWGFNDNDLDNIISHINNFRNAVSLVEKQTIFADEFVNIFNANKTNLNEKIGIMPVYTSSFGGGYFFVMKQNLSRDTIKKSIAELATKYTNCLIEYANREDGYGGGGVKIEQSIGNGIFSDYISEGNIKFITNQGEIYIGDYNDILEKEKSGLILDAIHKKIYLNGEKMTSKEIHSQSTTVDVLEKLIEVEGGDITNADLEVSSYSKNKNEMLGKIILPIVRLLQQEFGVELPIICKGSLGDYYLKLKKTNIRIGIIKRI